MDTFDPLPTFKLTRFFSTTSLIGVLVVTACLFLTIRELTERHLVAHEGRANANLTRAFANTIWRKHRAYVLNSTGKSREQLLADPALQPLRRELMAKMQGLHVVKIKIYNLSGVVVFSTDESQIGINKQTNPGFIAARAGGIDSQIRYDTTIAEDGNGSKSRNLIYSYVPIHAAQNQPPEGVFEVYSDVTELLDRQRRAQWQVAGVVLGLLGLLYLFLFFVVRKADRIMSRQEAERAAKEEEVRHQAYHDSLTGLPNRVSFSERLEESMALASRHDYAGALMFIDLDRFKMVNDSLGHHAGDELLQALASRIGSCLRTSDMLFRIGGDEFTVILPHVAMPEDAAFVARRILSRVAKPMQIQGHDLVPGATVGIAVYPGDGKDPETLLRNADAAMYSAKQASRGTYAFYRTDMNMRAQQRLDLESELRLGFERGEFLIHYQPRLSNDSGRVAAVEALARWNSPSRGLVLPDDFIGILEDTGLVRVFGNWVLRTSCAQAADWIKGDLTGLRLSVNISPIHFRHPSFIVTLGQILDETGLPPTSLELEITESILIQDTEQTRISIGKLRKMGVSVAIDDFGTGYSSLNYLRQFEVDYLKIDHTFVSEIETDARTRAVATAIIDLAKGLDLVLVAEGIETPGQASFFSGCRRSELQGFLFSDPVEAAQLPQAVRNINHAQQELDANAADLPGRPSGTSETAGAPWQATTSPDAQSLNS